MKMICRYDKAARKCLWTLEKGDIVHQFKGTNTQQTIIMSALVGRGKIHMDELIDLLWLNPDDEPEWLGLPTKIHYLNRRVLIKFNKRILSRHNKIYVLENIPDKRLEPPV